MWKLHLAIRLPDDWTPRPWHSAWHEAASTHTCCLSDWAKASSSQGSNCWTLIKSVIPLQISRTRSVVTVCLSVHGDTRKVRVQEWQGWPWGPEQEFCWHTSSVWWVSEKVSTVKTQRCKNCKDYVKLFWDQHLHHRGSSQIWGSQVGAKKDGTSFY